MKTLFQAAIIIALFFATWLTLSKIDWIKILRVEQITKSTENKIGDLFWDLYEKADQEIKFEKVSIPLDSILSKICVTNGIDKSKIKLHVVKDAEVNAFALPNNHLVINSGLILACENDSELSGVIGHEIAHMELDHVMKKLTKEVGLSVLISMTSGNVGSDKIKETVKLLSSSAYDRTLEKEADIKAVDYLVKTNIDPEPFANFLYRLAGKDSESTAYFSWISTHPDSKERAEYIIKYRSNKVNKTEPVLSIRSWDELKEYLEEE